MCHSCNGFASVSSAVALYHSSAPTATIDRPVGRRTDATEVRRQAGRRLWGEKRTTNSACWFIVSVPSLASNAGMVGNVCFCRLGCHRYWYFHRAVPSWAQRRYEKNGPCAAVAEELSNGDVWNVFGTPIKCRGRTGVLENIELEPSTCTVQYAYVCYWDRLDEKEVEVNLWAGNGSMGETYMTRDINHI